MSFCSVNGVGVVSGSLVLPRIGVWYADLELEDDSVQGGAATIAWWNEQLTLKGAVRYGGVREGGAYLHVVGGVGGLPAPVGPKAYRNVARRLVVNDLLAAAGESLSKHASQDWLEGQLPFWTLMRGTVGGSLALLVELEEAISWRVLADGSFWFGPEVWGVVSLPFEELDRDPGAYRMDVSVDVPALMPGCTFLGQRVSTVTYKLAPTDARAVLNFEAPT